MYQIYMDGILFFDTRVPELSLLDVKCEMELNKTGSLAFTLPPTHKEAPKLRKMKSELSLYFNNQWLFSGRVLNDKTDFYGIRQVSLEGELAYLLDSIQRTAEYHDISVSEYFNTLINIHNLGVEEKKKFEVGMVTVTDPNDSLYRFSNYENTWDTINDKLISRLGGFLRVRHENNIKILDYIKDYGNVNSQVIRIGENILNLTKEVHGEDLTTVIIPLGAKDEETNERIDITSVNGGKDYIEDTEAISLYGRIEKTVIYDDITLPSNLISKGYAALAEQKLLSTSLELTAVDMHLLNVSIERIKLGDFIRVVSSPHGIDEYMIVQKMLIDISNPENSTITLGTTRKTLIESITNGEKQSIDEIINSQKNIKEQISDVKIEINECYSEISKTAEEIKSDVSSKYLSKSEIETLQQDFETSITQSSEEIRMDFTTITNEIITGVSANQSLLEEYIRFKGALIELGKVGNAFTAELSNEELAFKENGQKIAFISNQNLVITNTEIRNKLSLGNEDRGWFDFIPRINGNLSIKWRNNNS